jgi:hypothetical protein
LADITKYCHPAKQRTCFLLSSGEAKDLLFIVILSEAKDLLFVVILSEAKDLLSPHPSNTWLASFSNCDTTYNLVVFCPLALNALWRALDVPK